MKNLLVYTSTLLLTLASCQQDNLIGEWNFNKVAETDASKTASHFSSTFFKSGAVFASNENFLIIDDGIANPFQLTNHTSHLSYSSSNRIVYGTWKRGENKHTILLNILNDTKKNEVILDEIKNDSKKLKVKFKTAGTDEKLASLAFFYTKDGDIDVSKSEYNYLSSELNSWRIPAKSSEGYKSINNRVKQSLEFALTYYEFCKSNDIKLSLGYLQPIPLRFASNGIATKHNPDWEALFYDQEQAEMSYKIIHDAFKASSKVPNHLNTSFDIGIYVLEQLISNIAEE